MHLNQLLEKLDLRPDDLTIEERKTYEQWSQVYSSSTVTVENLKTFIPTQLEWLRHQQNDYRNSEKKDVYLKATIRNLEMIYAFIMGPEKQKAWLDKTLQHKINQIK
jgi:hypothetical protein